MRTLILAGSFREASIYARARGLRHYRYAASATAVENFHAQRVVELPGFARRADKHALNGIVRRLERNGAEVVQDAYVPEPVEETVLTKLASFTRADWLFAGCELSDDELRAVGATEDEIKLLKPVLTEAQETAVRLANKGSGRDSETVPEATNQPKKPEPKPAAKPKRTRKDAPPPRRVTVKPGPPATKADREVAKANLAAARTPESTDSVDDLFED